VSGENLETVQRGFDAFNENGVEGILPLIHPDFEATTPPSLASEPDTYRGHDGVRRWFDSFYEVMDGIRWDARVLNCYALHLVTRGSGWFEWGSDRPRTRLPIKAPAAFWLFPGLVHSYQPDAGGWTVTPVLALPAPPRKSFAATFAV